MKKIVVLGTALVITALLVFSCNKNRFDFDHIESVEGSGQWKLPIGSLHKTLGEVFDQFADNDWITPDSNGNLRFFYSYAADDIIKGSNLLTIGTLSFSFETSMENPFPGVPLPEPVDTVFYFRQNLEVVGDSVGIETAIIESGQLVLDISTNLANVREIFLSSPDIRKPNGDTLYSISTGNSSCMVDLAGATFSMHDPVTGVPDSTLVLNYGFRCQLTGAPDPTYEISTEVGINDLALEEVSGYLDRYVFDFSFDTTFNLPLGNIQGEMQLVGSVIEINEKNTFGNLNAALIIDTAEFYGGGAAPSHIFHEYPFVLRVHPSDTYVNIYPESTIDLGFNTKFNGARLHASLDLNPSGVDELLSIYNTSSLGLNVNVTIPMQFNIPGVYYMDTIDINMSEIDAPEILKEILLTVLFDSEIPFDLAAQLYTLNSETGVITDSLMVNPMHIGGSFDGTSVHTETGISVTHERLMHLVEADKLVMRFGVNTDCNDVILNLENGLSVTLKADVIYGGEVELNN